MLQRFALWSIVLLAATCPKQYDFVGFHHQCDTETWETLDFQYPKTIKDPITRLFLEEQMRIYNKGEGDPETFKSLWKSDFKNTHTPKGNVIHYDMLSFFLWKVMKDSPIIPYSMKTQWVQVALGIIIDRFDFACWKRFMRHLRWLLDTKGDRLLISDIKERLEPVLANHIRPQLDSLMDELKKKTEEPESEEQKNQIQVIEWRMKDLRDGTYFEYYNFMVNE